MGVTSQFGDIYCCDMYGMCLNLLSCVLAVGSVVVLVVFVFTFALAFAVAAIISCAEFY